MDVTDSEHFQGFSENRYQHTMHTLAWISLVLIVIVGVATGIWGMIHGLSS